MYSIAAFYKFVDLPDFAAWRQPVLSRCEAGNVLGTILLAGEGVNGTIAGSADAVEAVLDLIRDDIRFSDLVVKRSEAKDAPFVRLKVRLKNEIVSLGVGSVDVVHGTGNRVQPDEWNDLIADPNVIVIDTRNGYEHAIGTFEGAISPQTLSFTDFPQWVAESPDLQGKPKIAMFCTGGIRCEKASAYLRDQGFEEVYQLDGGILRYLEMVPARETSWNGECYVFDRRVSVGHGLVPGDNEICINCDRVLTPQDRTETGYVRGVSCDRCFDTITDDRKARFSERQHQIELSEERGTVHLGTT